MRTKVVFEHRTGSHAPIYMVYRWTDDRWVPQQYFKHTHRKKAIEYACDLSKCEYGGETTIWQSDEIEK